MGLLSPKWWPKPKEPPDLPDGGYIDCRTRNQQKISTGIAANPSPFLQGQSQTGRAPDGRYTSDEENSAYQVSSEAPQTSRFVTFLAILNLLFRVFYSYLIDDFVLFFVFFHGFLYLIVNSQSTYFQLFV